MDSAEFRKRGKEMVDYIADYVDSVSERRVTADVRPGYMRDKVASSAPDKGEDWAAIMKDVDDVIMPGITHWQHPRFHAYFPMACSYPSILGDMLSAGLGANSFTWIGSPACTELEVTVTDWVAQMVGLPETFLHTSSVGGGVIQSSSSESVLVALLAARHAAIAKLRSVSPGDEPDGALASKLVAYASRLAHSCVEKAAKIGLVTIRHLDADDDFSLRGSTLKAAIDADRSSGLVPFFACATLGTTSCCSFDNLDELGHVCREETLWLHVDAAYAGSALICPEFRYLARGIEHAKSMNCTAHKWMRVNVECSLL